MKKALHPGKFLPLSPSEQDPDLSVSAVAADLTINSAKKGYDL
jgi:hypothetical protein